MHQTREDSLLLKVMMFVLSVELVRLQQEIIVVQGLPLNEADVIIGVIFLMPFSYFRDQEAFLPLLKRH